MTDRYVIKCGDYYVSHDPSEFSQSGYLYEEVRAFARIFKSKTHVRLMLKKIRGRTTVPHKAYRLVKLPKANVSCDSINWCEDCSEFDFHATTGRFLTEPPRRDCA